MMSSMDEIDIDPYAINGNIDLDEYSDSSVWQLVSTKIETPQYNDNFTRIKFIFTLKRLRLYYVVNLLLPVLLLSCTSFMVFYLPAESGEKVGMGITVLLAYTVYLTILGEKMPETSQQVSLLGVYITILLFLSSFTVILSVIVLNIHHRDTDIPIPPYITDFIRRWRPTLQLGVPKSRPININQVKPIQNTDSKSDVRMCMIRPANGDELRERLAELAKDEKKRVFPDDDQSFEEEEITWPKVAQTLDRMFLFISIVIVISVTIILLPLMVILADS